MKKTKVFAVSVISIRSNENYPQGITHTIFVVKALSEEEAIGKGVLKGIELSPMKDGWSSPYVLATEIFPEWFNKEESDED